METREDAVDDTGIAIGFAEALIDNGTAHTVGAITQGFISFRAVGAPILSRHHRVEGLERHHGRRRSSTTGITSNGTTAHLSSVERKSEKECGDGNHRTVSFLRLPCLILGGNAVEWCSVLHDDSVVVNNIIYILNFVSFVLLTVDKIYFMW